MFTGLIECLGTVQSIERSGTSIVLGIRPDDKLFRLQNGASVAVDGACLTVERDSGTELYFSAVMETLRRTTLSRVNIGRRVNLERALLVGGRLDGHMVQGHIDDFGTIISDQDVGGSVLRKIRVPSELKPFIAEKGSVAVDGISLTITSVQDNEFVISFIPATIKKTTMSLKRIGDSVNIECDVLARYLYRMITAEKSVADDKMPEVSFLTKMERLGF
jgi:riboflavin synthase